MQKYELFLKNAKGLGFFMHIGKEKNNGEGNKRRLPFSMEE